MIPGSANSLLLASAAGAAQYQIERSLRFNSADSSSLTQASYSGSGTFSAWVKRCKLSAAQTIISGVSFNASDQLNNSTAVFRDPSAWMHVVVSSLGTYVNNTSVASGSAIAPGAIGSGCDLHLADIHFIDGQSLTPSSFGYIDSNGIWQPKAYTGTYGTNGFHLDFADNSAATTAGIGKDVSGNGNDWTPNNLSVAAGAGNDSLVDTPTNGSQTDTGVGGEVVGNYATLNPLQNFLTLANGNLDASQATVGHHPVYGTVGISSGKWYFEFTKNDNVSSSNTSIAIGVVGSRYTGINNSSAFSINTAHTAYIQSGTQYYDDVTYPTTTPNSATCHNAGTWMLAYDFDNGKGWIGKDGVWFSPGATSGGDPANGTNPIFTNFTAGTTYVPILHLYADTSVSANFGQRPFAYTAPSGFKALCTTNLPSTTVTTSGNYTGNGVADGPFIYLNGVPTAMTVNGNAVTFGTEADKLSNGFKVRTTSTTYNQNAATYNYSITSTGDPFKVARAQSNP